MEKEDLAHDEEHVLRVYRWAVRLAAEVNVDPDLAGAAALLHDVVNIPKESDQRSMAADLSAIKGAEVLCTLPAKRIAVVLNNDVFNHIK